MRVCRSMYLSRSLLLLVVTAALSVSQAHAITYQFSSSAIFHGGAPEVGAISGTFDYDPYAVEVGDDGGLAGTFYVDAMTNLSGSWNTDTFSDPRGFGGVWNDSLVDVGINNVDLVQLTADAPLLGDLVGFQKDFGGQTYQLSNVRIFWIEENYTVGTYVDDFLDNELLPSTLPPTPDINGARIALDFTNINDVNDVYYVFGLGLNVTPVPLPPALWMMLVSLGGLVVAKRRR